MIGRRFGRLLVVTHEGAWCACRCDCGTEKKVRGKDLRNGRTKSCGCLLSDVARATIAQKLKGSKGRLTHGHTLAGQRQSRTYRSWKGAKNRCFNLHEPSWWHYGGRGISMCDKWRYSFAAFLADMGECPAGRSLDRINNNGNYEPGNCRWATSGEQRSNQRKRKDSSVPPSWWTAEERVEALHL
jgi:hypothetical protein